VLPAPLTTDHRVTPHEPLSLPLPPTPMSAAFRFVEPVWRNYIMYVDMESREGNADAARYLHCWQSLTPEEQRLHMPE
jgi:hypothetical protein